MIDAYQGGNMVAVMNVPADETGSYGIITPKDEAGQLVTIADIVEKPDPEVAQSTLAVVGRYIIEPGVFDKLAEGKKGAGGEIQLTDSLAARISDVPFLGLRFSGERFDCGSKLGFLKANIAFARSRPELRDDIEKWLANTLLSQK
jgi:UTP--glucose-1-phosphate uridylyltransferase